MLIYMIAVLPGQRIKTAMGGIAYRHDLLYHNIAGQDGIEVVAVFCSIARYGFGHIYMKIVLQGMYPGIGTGGAGKFKALAIGKKGRQLFAVIDVEGFFQLGLHGIGIALCLKATVLLPFVS